MKSTLAKLALLKRAEKQPKMGPKIGHNKKRRGVEGEDLEKQRENAGAGGPIGPQSQSGPQQKGKFNKALSCQHSGP
jgi:hypothetical protein